MSTFLFSLVLWGCSEDPTIKGTVLDVWNKPVEGAMVQMEGVVESQKTDSSGAFSFALPSGTDGELRFRAGHEGFIHDVEIAVYSKDIDDDKIPSIQFNLFPKPEQKGFFGIGSEGYLPLQGEKTKSVATKLEKFSGLVDIGSTSFKEGSSLISDSNLAKTAKK